MKHTGVGFGYVMVLTVLASALFCEQAEAAGKPAEAEYRVTQERVYDVRIDVSSAERAEELRKLGIQPKDRVLSRQLISEELLAELRNQAFQVEVVGKAVKVTLKRDVPPQIQGPALGHQSPCNENYQWGWNTQDVQIIDNGQWVNSEISITFAPFKSRVTKIKVECQLFYSEWADLEIRLEDDDLGAPFFTLWYHNFSGSGLLWLVADNIHTFDDLEEVNQTWTLRLRDDVSPPPVQTGYLDWWEIYVYYDEPSNLQYPWPLYPNDQPHYVTGTFDEFRKNGNWRFHAGLDARYVADPPPDRKVYSVSSGVVKSCGTGCLEVGDFTYFHVHNRIPDLGSWINCGVYLCDYTPGDNHVELRDGIEGNYYNPLDWAWGIQPFDDTAPPRVISGSIKLKDRFGNDVPVDEVKGDIQIIAEIYDAMSLGSNKCNPYEIGWGIKLPNNQVVQEYTRLRFDNFYSWGADRVYTPDCKLAPPDPASRFFYYVTSWSSPPSVDYWHSTDQVDGQYKLCIKVTDHRWNENLSDNMILDECINITIKNNPPGVKENARTPFVPATFSIQQNAPNPFVKSVSGKTQIAYQVPQEVQVLLVVYDCTGAKVVSFVDGVRQPGRYIVEWDGTDDDGIIVPQGVYFCRMVAGEFRETKKLVLMH